MRLGILGGGQLGRMTAMAATKLNIATHIYCPETDCPASFAATKTNQGSYEDLEALKVFASQVDVITFEFENIPYKSVQALEAIVPVRPGWQALHIGQNRVREKEFATSCGVPVTPYAVVKSAVDFEGLTFPLILKTQEMGYDGKGQQLIESGQDIPEIAVPSIAENKIDLKTELSVIVARDPSGHMECYDVAENRHEKGILIESLAPAKNLLSLGKKCQEYAMALADKAEVIGLLAVEFFVDREGNILFNEMAPRPHNTGHWTMDGWYVNQFEQLVRAVCGLKLAVPKAHTQVRMTNILGYDIEKKGAYMAKPNTFFYDYGKKQAREGRKMAHVNELMG